MKEPTDWGVVAMNEYRLEDISVIVIKKNRVTGQVMQFRFPHVSSMNISTDVTPTEHWDDGFASYAIAPSVRAIEFDGRALRDDVEGIIMEVREIVPAQHRRRKK